MNKAVRYLSGPRTGTYLLSGTSTGRQMMMHHTKTPALAGMAPNTSANAVGTPHHHHSHDIKMTSIRQLSTSPSAMEEEDQNHHYHDDDLTVCADDLLLHKQYSVRRTFAANSNAQVMLTCGGESLAAHASFDPMYSRARTYIRNHPVGPAVLSPILIGGLVGTLIEATLPQSIFVKNEMRQHLPLIVGVEVEASIEVVSVKSSPPSEEGQDESSWMMGPMRRTGGQEVEVKTQVKRVMDGAIISDGSQTVWMPDYGRVNM